MKSVLRPVACVVLALSGLALGCGSDDRPELGDVTGTVTLNGQPLAAAAVIFQPTGQNTGRASRSVTDQEGHYRLNYLRDIDGAVVGSHKVYITTASEESPEEHLPGKYSKPRETVLTAEVTGNGDTIDFALTTP